MLQKVQARLANRKGFTLIELIVVIAIIVILIALIAPNAVKMIDTAENTKLLGNAKTAFTAAQAYVTSAYGTAAQVKDGDITEADLKEFLTADMAKTAKITATVTGSTVTQVVYVDNGKTATYPAGTVTKP